MSTVPVRRFSHLKESSFFSTYDWSAFSGANMSAAFVPRPTSNTNPNTLAHVNIRDTLTISSSRKDDGHRSGP